MKNTTGKSYKEYYPEEYLEKLGEDKYKEELEKIFFAKCESENSEDYSKKELIEMAYWQFYTEKLVIPFSLFKVALNTLIGWPVTTIQMISPDLYKIVDKNYEKFLKGSEN